MNTYNENILYQYLSNWNDVPNDEAIRNVMNINQMDTHIRPLCIEAHKLNGTLDKIKMKHEYINNNEQKDIWCSHCELFRKENIDSGILDKLYDEVYNYAKTCTFETFDLKKVHTIKESHNIVVNLYNEVTNKECSNYNNGQSYYDIFGSFEYDDLGLSTSCNLISKIIPNAMDDNLMKCLIAMSIYVILYDAKYIANSAGLKKMGYDNDYINNANFILDNGYNKYRPPQMQSKRVLSEYWIDVLLEEYKQQKLGELYQIGLSRCSINYSHFYRELDKANKSKSLPKRFPKLFTYNAYQILSNIKSEYMYIDQSISMYNENTRPNIHINKYDHKFMLDGSQFKYKNRNSVYVYDNYYYVFGCDMEYESINTKNKKSIYKILLDRLPKFIVIEIMMFIYLY